MGAGLPACACQRGRWCAQSVIHADALHVTWLCLIVMICPLRVEPLVKGRHQTDRLMQFLELRIPPVAAVSIAAAAMAVLAWAVPASIPLVASTRLVVSIALVLAGAWVGMAGVVAFRRHKTTVNPFTPERSSSLVSTGIYRFSRNPMYLGLLLVLAGWSVFLANWVAALLLPAFVVYMNRFQIRPEERALSEKFGSQFIAYASSVRRWL